jgi:hypothetical protein
MKLVRSSFPSLLPALAGVLVLAPLDADAVTTCRARIARGDGVIRVSAWGVTGSLRWGGAAGQETNPFFNSCVDVASGRAVDCRLGAPGSAEEITPPELCRVHLADDGPAACSAYIKGCTPGARSVTAAPPALHYETCTGSVAAGGGAQSSCAATCPPGHKVSGGTCHSPISSQLPFVQAVVCDPGADTQWCCTVRNQNAVSANVQAEGTAICLPQP